MDDEQLSTKISGTRAYVFEDLTIRSDGDGRTVEAYAAAFNVRAEIKDADGHYNEILAPGSFTKTISDNGLRFGVFYNHARTLAGTPDGALSVPIGVPLEVAQDERGVFTVTRYLDNPLADSVLDGIKQRAIRGQSFSGRFLKSSRSRASRGDLPTITRQEVAMREYGPTVFPAYSEAMILGTRSVEQFIEEIRAADPEDLDRLRQIFGGATASTTSNTFTLSLPTASTGTPSGAAEVEEPPAGHSARLHRHYRAEARKEGGPLS